MAHIVPYRMFTEPARFLLAFGVSGSLHAAFLYGLPFDLAPAPPLLPVPAALQVQITQAPGRPHAPPASAPPVSASLASSIRSEVRTPALAKVRAVRRPVETSQVETSETETSQAAPPMPLPATPVASTASQSAEMPLAGADSSRAESSPAPLALSSAENSVATFPAPRHPPAPTRPDPGTPDAPLDAPIPSFAPPPEYPEEARWEKRVGRALLAFQLRPDGSARQIKLLASSGHTDLDSAAVESLKLWRFNQSGGAPTAAWYKYAFRFEVR